MYPSSGSSIRADINAFVEQAAAADKFFISDRVLPPFGVDAMSATYPKVLIAEAELLSAGATDRQRSASYGEVSRSWTTDNYTCVDRGIEEPIDDIDAKDLSRFFNVEVAKARWLLRNLKTAQEVRVAAAVLSTALFGSATNSAVAYTEALIATINFPKDILDAIERVNDKGCEANTIVLSSTVINRIKRSTLLQNFCRGAFASDATLNLTAAAIAQAFADNGITQCLVGRARYNSAKKGQAYSAASVWGTTYVWVGQVANGDPSNGGAGRILTWNAEGGLYVSETYRDEKRRSNMIRVRQNTVEKIIDGTAGTLIATQWA